MGRQKEGPFADLHTFKLSNQSITRYISFINTQIEAEILCENYKCSTNIIMNGIIIPGWNPLLHLMAWNDTDSSFVEIYQETLIDYVFARNKYIYNST